MIKLKNLVHYLDNLLEISNFPKDRSNNGLQIEGKNGIRKAVFSVDASLKLFKEAVKRKADFIFVHHGLSWNDNLKRITSLDSKRISVLMSNGISLYGVHLPLDAHPVLGHNAQIAKMLSLKKCRMFAKYAEKEIGVAGEIPAKSTPRKIAGILDKKLGTKTKIIGDADCEIRRIGIVSGGGGCEITDAYNCDLDCFVTGEITHSDIHLIHESGIPVILAGHYFSEKPGVLAVMDEIRKKFKIECEFIDLPTGY